MTFQLHLIEESFDFIGKSQERSVIMFGANRHLNSRDIMLLFVEDTFGSIRHYCFYLKDMARKYTVYQINNRNSGHKHVKHQLEKKLKNPFARFSKNGNEKEKQKTRKAID